MTTNSALEEKWWYRLLKVAYILLYVLSVVFVVAVSASELPQRYIDDTTTSIRCNSGSTYLLNQNSIYVFGDTLSSVQDKDARILCAYGSTNFYAFYSYTIPQNYTFTPHYIEPNYGAWLAESILFLLIVLVFLKLVRIGVLYVMLGARPSWIKEFRKIY